MRKFLTQELLPHWEARKQALARIEAMPEVRKYGDPVRRAEVIKTNEAWRETAVAKIQAFRAGAWLAKQAETTRAREQALARIRRGTPPANAAGAQDRATDPVVSRLDALLQAQRTTLALTLYSSQPTDVLRARLGGYVEVARRGAEFAYQAWAVDSRMVTAILEGRAAGGDDRARMALESARTMVAAVEGALVERAVPSAADAEAAEMLGKSEDVITGAARGDQASMRAVEDWFGFMGRAVQMRAQVEGDAAPTPPRAAQEDVCTFLL